jgi:hypothetical protein
VSVDPKAFEMAASIQREFENQFARLPTVVGIGLGLNAAEDAPAISVQVTHEPAPNALPKTFHGLDVVVDVVGKIHAY